MRVWFYVDAKNAVVAGKSQSGYLPLDLDDEQMGELTDEQRETLAGVPSLGDATTPKHPDYCIRGVVAPTLDELRQALDQMRDKTLAEEQQEQERERERIEEAEEVLRKRKTDTRKHSEYDHGISAHWDKISPDWAYMAPEQVRKCPEALAWQAELDAINAAAQATAQREITAQLEVREKRIAAAQAAEQLYDDACDEVIRQHGTPSQIERLEAGVLPDEERHAVAYDHIFAALGDHARYERLTDSDIDHEGDCYGESVDYTARKMDEIDADTWDVVRDFKRRLPAAEITPRIHMGTCSACDGEAKRISISVTIPWHGKSHTREYAAS